MPVVDHHSLEEKPWRPDYHSWAITHEGDGTTFSTLSWSLVGVGVGAPLHFHKAEELIVVLEGSLTFRVGEEVYLAGPDHTVIIPANTPHSFTNPGPGVVKIMAFFPIKDPFKGTTYLEGEPPRVHLQRSRVRYGPSGGCA